MSVEFFDYNNMSVEFLDYNNIIFILSGVWVTLQYSLISVFCGLILGSILALLKISKIKILQNLAYAYTSIFRGTPMLVQITIIYFGLPGVLGIKLSVFTAGILALSCNSAAYTSEIIRAGINSIDKGQSEAAEALGIPYFLLIKDIILPQAFRNILPALVNELINLIKESALISTIGGMDLMKRAHVVSAETYSFFLPMLTAALGYYILVLIISTIANILEKKLVL